jgi:hypothetical protein
MQMQATAGPVQPAAAAQDKAPAEAPAIQEEMRKLIDAARTAVADLQAAATQPPASLDLVPPLGIQEPSTTASTPEEAMRKVIDAARAAVTALEVDVSAHGGASPGPKASKRRPSRRRT